MAVAPVVGIALVFHSTYYSYTAHTERSRQLAPGLQTSEPGMGLSVAPVCDGQGNQGRLGITQQ